MLHKIMYNSYILFLYIVFYCLSLLFNVMFIFNNCFLSHHSPQGPFFFVHHFFFFLSLSLPLHSLFFVCSLLSFACISFFFSYIQTNRTHTHTHVYRETYMKRHLLEMFAGGVEKRMSTCEDRKYLHLLLLLF